MLGLLDYRRRNFALYQEIRSLGTASTATHARFRTGRDALFFEHPQSALTEAQRGAFDALPYYAYDPAFRVVAAIEPVDNPPSFDIPAGDDGTVTIRQFGTASFSLPGGDASLSIFWITGYGGGVFIPFRDATNGDVTYGGGRYLLDTIKGADLGTADDGRLILDFNYAYHPSCAYNPIWTCPLAPPTNHLSLSVEAGERSLPALD